MNFPDSRLFEQLAAIEHERWSDWERYEFSVCEKGKDGTLSMGSRRVAPLASGRSYG